MAIADWNLLLGTLSYACGHEDCDQTFAKWSLLQQHLKKDHIIECATCGNTFTRRDTLKAHMKTHDEERDLFPCNWPGCSKVLTSVGLIFDTADLGFNLTTVSLDLVYRKRSSTST
jgi:hypothetical protein